MAIIIPPSVDVPNAVEKVGVIFNHNFSNGTDIFTKSDPNVVFTTGDSGLRGVGGLGNFANKLTFTNPVSKHKYTCLDQWSQSIEVSPNVINANSYGVSLGVESVHPTASVRYGVAVRFAIDLTSYLGKIQFFTLKNTAFTARQETVTGFVPIVGRNYEFKVFRIGMTLFAIITEDGEVMNMDSYTIPLTAVNNDRVMHNRGRFFMAHNGGDTLYNNYKCWSDAPKKVDFIAIGDSNLNRQWAGNNYKGGYFDLLFLDKSKDYHVCAGSGDTIFEANLAREEISVFTPSVIYVNFLRNAKAFGISDASAQAEYDDLLSYLDTLGATIVLGTPIQSNLLDLSSATDYIRNKGYPYTDLNALTLEGGGLKELYDRGDGIHLNPLGHIAASNKLRSDVAIFRV